MFSSSQLSGCTKQDSEVYFYIRKYLKLEEMETNQSWRVNKPCEDPMEYRTRRGSCPRCGKQRLCECIVRQRLSQMTIEDGIVPDKPRHNASDPTTPTVLDPVNNDDLSRYPGAPASSIKQNTHLSTAAFHRQGPTLFPSLEGAILSPAPFA